MDTGNWTRKYKRRAKQEIPEECGKETQPRTRLMRRLFKTSWRKESYSQCPPNLQVHESFTCYIRPSSKIQIQVVHPYAWYLMQALSQCHLAIVLTNACILQPLFCDIMIRARMSTNLLLADLKRPFLQIGIKEKDWDAFRFLFNINDQEKHFRFTRVPFDAEASPFMLGTTLSYHYDQPTKLKTTVESLRRDTYVDNLIKTGDTKEELHILKEAMIVFERENSLCTSDFLSIPPQTPY